MSYHCAECGCDITEEETDEFLGYCPDCYQIINHEISEEDNE